MVKRVFAGLLLVAALGSGQRRVDPKNTYSRVICVVPLVGTGTTDDPKRPQYAPWPSDEGKYAVAEFVSRNRLALQPILNDKTIKVFEEGRQSKASIESAIKPFRKDFDLTKFGMVMP